MIRAFAWFDFIAMALLINYLLFDNSQNNNKLQLTNILEGIFSYLVTKFSSMISCVLSTQGTSLSPINLHNPLEPFLISVPLQNPSN